MKIQLLIPYPLKTAPSQRFRFEQYLEILDKNGFQVKSQSFWDDSAWQILYCKGFYFTKVIGFTKGVMRRLCILFQLSRVEFVFIHRECLPVGPPFIEWILAKILRKKIIYDFDDAIWLSNTSAENKAIAFLKWHRKVASICKWSWKISCGNSFLASYAIQFNKNVVVNPTTIDTINLHNPSRFIIEKKSNPVIIGWTGTQSTLPYIISLIPILQKLEQQFPDQFRLLIIANKDPKLSLKFVDYLKWSIKTEIQDLSKMDIGLMPLTDDIWAKGKCGFKALQYMALEIPTIVSPVGVNNEIIKNGIDGYLCKTETEWLRVLTQLIEDKNLRKGIGSAGRKKITSNYSVVSNSSVFLDLFS